MFRAQNGEHITITQAVMTGGAFLKRERAQINKKTKMNEHTQENQNELSKRANRICI